MTVELPELANPNDLISEAVKNYVSLKEEQFIQVWLNGIRESDYEASYFMRSYDQMPLLEQEALKHCKGKILDIGAGAGPHSKYLNHNGHDVTALESNSGFCSLLKSYKGLRTIHTDFFKWSTNQKFDTVLLLMNGFGISKSEEGLDVMLNQLLKIVTPEGQILAEITDYNFSEHYDHEIKENPQAQFRLAYNGQFSSEFEWFYPRLDMIEYQSKKRGLKLTILYQEEETMLLQIKSQ